MCFWLFLLVTNIGLLSAALFLIKSCWIFLDVTLYGIAHVRVSVGKWLLTVPRLNCSTSQFGWNLVAIQQGPVSRTRRSYYSRRRSCGSRAFICSVHVYVHRVSKKLGKIIFVRTYSNFHRFKYFLTGRCQNVRNFTWYIHFPPHLIYVATLPCKTQKSSICSKQWLRCQHYGKFWDNHFLSLDQAIRWSQQAGLLVTSSCPVFDLKFSVKTSKTAEV